MMATTIVALHVKAIFGHVGDLGSIDFHRMAISTGKQKITQSLKKKSGRSDDAEQQRTTEQECNQPRAPVRKTMSKSRDDGSPEERNSCFAAMELPVIGQRTSTTTGFD
jgi:hypothetical protein